MPVSPYPSWRDPTKIVRLTVTLGLDASGKRSTRRPLGSRYSVIPSTEATLVGAADWARATPAEAAHDASRAIPIEHRIISRRLIRRSFIASLPSPAGER
ncbi:MAG: hypothetical protein U0790_15445 [Isosphaeraceae bacterium]